MRQHLCLNCSETFFKNFCPNCGQKADTHRITFKHFVMHDLLHGVWHLERGILFTLKETIVRPGQAALDYIAGKRIRYYNVFYLCLLLIGACILIFQYKDLSHLHWSKSQNEMMTFMGRNIKFIVLTFVPFIALNGFMIYRRLKLNLSEHFIVGGICLLGMMLCSTLFIALSFISKQGNLMMISKIIQSGMGTAVLLYPAWTYYSATKKHYKFGGYLWRMGVFYVLMLLEFLLLMGFLVIIATSESEIIIN